MIGQYLNTLRVQRRLTPKTLALYELELRKLESFGRDLTKIENHLGSVAPVTHARKLIIWKQYLHSVGDNLLDRFSAPIVRKKSTAFLNDAEIASFESYCVRNLDLEDQLFVELGLTLGLRLSEILQINSTHIDNDCIIIMRKGEHEQRLPLTKSLLDKIRNFQGFTKSKRRYQQLINSVAKKCGFRKKVTPHTLRHSFATRAVQKGANICAVMEFLGHSSLATTQKYLHVTTENLREVIQTKGR